MNEKPKKNARRKLRGLIFKLAADGAIGKRPSSLTEAQALRLLNLIDKEFSKGEPS